MSANRAGKKRNQQSILRLLRTEGTLTRQEIAQRLGLSMPTALQNTTELLEYGLLEECGEMESTGGRRAKKLALNENAGFGLGIDIALHQAELVLVNLKGKLAAHEALPLTFRDDTAWYRDFQRGLERFLQEPEAGRLLCAGLSFPGIIDDSRGIIVHSHIFGLKNVSLDRFCRSVPFPLLAANDANCACFAERDSERTDYFYLSLNESVGGAMLRGGELCYGDNWQAGEVGHMILVPNGKRCYCGKRGCVDPYLSPNALTQEGQDVEDFFRRLENGDAEARELWEEYLENLAIVVTNLRMLYDTDIILGGTVGTKLKPYMRKLCEKAAKYDYFARDIDYLAPCRRSAHAFAAGAAMLALERYQDRLLDEKWPHKAETDDV